MRMFMNTFFLLGMAVILFLHSYCPISVFADENELLPEPIKVVDFSYTFDELSEQYEDFEVVENKAKPVMVMDEEMGQVLQLQKAIIKDRKFAEYIDEETGEIRNTGVIEDENTEYSTIKLDNPYAGIEHLVEYAPYEDVKIFDDGGIKQPLWENGITISYWIKVPQGINSNVVGFTSERFQIYNSDYTNYLATVKFDLEYSKYSDEEKITLGFNSSGVDKTSEFYYEIAEEATYLGKPLYNDNMGDLYWLNKNYEPGYIKKSDGTIVECEINGGYSDYVIAPLFGDTNDNHNAGESKLRYGWTKSEMWLDASSSFYFVDDVCPTIQLNPNHEESYNTELWMQEFDCFNINSWKSRSTIKEACADNTAGPSPSRDGDEWHCVTVVIQNDWVQYYMDGAMIDIAENYSSYGTSSLAPTMPGYKPWKHFNKGTGARNSYGTVPMKDIGLFMTGYCSPTIMEWITLDCVDMTIGGGNICGDAYNMYAETDEIMLKNIAFYDTILTDEQIAYLATEPNIFGTDYNGAAGDLNLDKKITARDALLILKHVAKIETVEEDRLHLTDVNGDGVSNANDALDILKYVAGLANGWTVDGVVY